jgi:hypothetical protein
MRGSRSRLRPPPAPFDVARGVERDGKNGGPAGLMRLRAISTVLLSSVALAACATFRPPEISYDDDPNPALFQSDPPKPVEVVEIPKTATAPGPAQGRARRKNLRTGAEGPG